MRDLLKQIELDLRGNSKLSRDTYEHIAELSDWEVRIINGFITEVNLSIASNNLNFIYREYLASDSCYGISEFSSDLLIVSLKREQLDTVITDVVNRLVIPKNISWDYLEIWGLEVDKARNYAVEKCLESGFKKLFFIDDDMVLENTALIKLWETQDLTGRMVVAADYPRKADHPISANGAFFDLDKFSNLKETDLCAMGCTLINIEKVTEKVPLPLFWIFRAPDGLWSMGEDAFFTRNLIEKTGERPVIDFSISVLHYDKRWKRIFGKRQQEITYATSAIFSSEQFNNERQPPLLPLITFCLPLRDEKTLIATDLFKLISLRGYSSTILTSVGNPVDTARNQLVTDSVKAGSDYIFFLDNDIVLPQDALVKMLEVMEADKDHLIGAVTGDYTIKGELFHSVHLQLDHSGQATELNRLEKENNSSVNNNWLIGLGCCLVRTEVFRQLQFPWFLLHSENPDGTKTGEDAHFCELMFRNGYQIKILTDIQCFHVDYLSQIIFGPDLSQEEISKYCNSAKLDKFGYLSNSKLSDL